MKKRSLLIALVFLASVSIGMGRNPDQYDEEARDQEKNQKILQKELPAEDSPSAPKNFATGLKEMTVDNVKDTLSDTAEGTVHEKPVVGTLDGAQKAGDKVVDNTIKGVKKVVSLGYAKDSSYEIQEAEEGSGDAAKIKLFQF